MKTCIIYTGTFRVHITVRPLIERTRSCVNTLRLADARLPVGALSGPVLASSNLSITFLVKTAYYIASGSTQTKLLHM